MTDAEGLYLDRPGQRQLLDLLGNVRGLWVDLQVTKRRQDRTTPVGQRGTSRHRPSEQPLPLNVGAMQAGDSLHETLAAWASYVCEQRGLAYDPPAGQPGSPVPIARWLAEHVDDLAYCEHADQALTQIKDAIDAAVQVVLGPQEPAIAPIDAERLAQARGIELHARGIEAAARELGPQFAGLTRRRVHTLHEGGHLTPTRRYSEKNPPTTGIPLFTLGQALDAHKSVPTRRRKAAA